MIYQYRVKKVSEIEETSFYEVERDVFNVSDREEIFANLDGIYYLPSKEDVYNLFNRWETNGKSFFCLFK